MVSTNQLSTEVSSEFNSNYELVKAKYIAKLLERGLTAEDISAIEANIDAIGYSCTPALITSADGLPSDCDDISEIGGIATVSGVDAPSYGGINPNNISSVSNINDPNYGVNPIYNSTDSSHKGAGGTSSVSPASSASELAKAEASHAIIHKNREDREVQESLLAEAHDIQDSTNSLYWEDPVFPEPVFTAPIAIQNARYTLDEDYPNSYGFIDKIGNWFKVNMVKMHIEFVHNKGSNFKIDKDSNSVLHLKGSHKQMIAKDYSQQIAMNRDILVDLDSFEHISGEVIQLINKKSYQRVGGVYTQELGDNAKITIEGDSEHTINKDSKMLVTKNMEWKIGETAKILVGQSLEISSADGTTITCSDLRTESTLDTKSFSHKNIKNESLLDTENVSHKNLKNEAIVNVETKAGANIKNTAIGTITNKAGQIINTSDAVKINNAPDIVYNMSCGTITMCEIIKHIKG